ncbi:DUF2510 domain-containing protein [Nocardia sp. NPDC004340]
MGFYLGKSLRAGPFRFNLSTAGVGVSVGVPGFRLGTGPRGNYVSVGAGGIRYRTSIGAGTAGTPGPAVSPSGVMSQRSAPLTDLSGASAESLVPTGGDDLVRQLDIAARRWRWSLIATFIVVIVGLATFPFGLIAGAVALPAIWWLAQFDQGRRNVVVFYDVEGASATWFESLVTDAQAMAQAQKLWRLQTSRQLTGNHQRKTNALAGSLVQRSSLTLTFTQPKHLITNVVVPTLTCGRDALYLLPDRVLVRSGSAFSDIAYSRLCLNWSASRFIENSAPPRDARQVDTRWQYSNLNGGPDRRFKNNRRLPVMLYDELSLTTQEGLSWILQSSKPDSARQLGNTLERSPVLTVIDSPATSFMHTPVASRPAPTAPTPPGRAAPLPNWFPDPANTQLLRWWDGRGWTEHTQPVQR